MSPTPLQFFDFELPAELIAQAPATQRDQSRLLHLDRSTDRRAHHRVADLPDLLREGDLLVVNDTRVFPARLLGRRDPSGGRVECLLLSRLDDARWDVLLHPGQKLKEGAQVVFDRPGAGTPRLRLEVLARRFHGRRTVRLVAEDGGDVDAAIDVLGTTPLPPYIHRPAGEEDRSSYQTLFARTRGSVAAPTAGLHFTPELVRRLEARGVERTEVTLHVGYGTFEPIRSDDIESHHVWAERFAISERAAGAINQALDEGRRVVAVGTTTTRTLESAAAESGGRLRPGAGETELYIQPGHEFRVVGALMTNFHLPQSSLLVLVSALAGRESVLAAYREAVERRYRFYSYGDAMLIT